MSTVWLVWCYREDAREWWLLAVAADREQAVRFDVDLDTILGGAESVDVTTKGEAL